MASSWNEGERVESASTQPKHSGSFKSREEFLSNIVPLAKQVGSEIGLDWRLIVAQSALETGWGSKVKGNSFFGIKGHGSDKTTTFTTQEVIDGKRVTIQDKFRAYDSLEDSVRGYGKFLLDNPRYSKYLSSGNIQDAARELQKSGYATDPNYGKKVLQIAQGKILTDFVDKQQPTPQNQNDQLFNSSISVVQQSKTLEEAKENLKNSWEGFKLLDEPELENLVTQLYSSKTK